VSTTSILSKTSSLFFFTGFVFSKIQNLPIPVVAPVMNAIALVFYMLGYSVWFISSHFFPNNTPQKNEWYGFAQFKEQYLYGAALGIIGCILSLAALASPILFMPAAWIFLASNLMWTAAEYNKLNNPPSSDENYSKSFQESYLSYAITMTAMTAITAVCTLLIFMFPPLTLSVLIISTVLSIGLTILAGDIWLDFTFGNHKPTPVEQSHNHLGKSLGIKPEATETDEPAPYQGIELFKSSKYQSSQESPISDLLPTQTCSMP
jgi:uncharacterized membrane protein YbaN (DUF454 family)